MLFKRVGPLFWRLAGVRSVGIFWLVLSCAVDAQDAAPHLSLKNNSLESTDALFIGQREEDELKLSLQPSKEEIQELMAKRNSLKTLLQHSECRIDTGRKLTLADVAIMGE